MIAIMSDRFIDQFVKLAGPARQMQKGTLLFARGDTVDTMFFVASGRVDLTRYHTNGNSIVLQSASGPSVLAEASLYADTYHCDAYLAEQSAIQHVSKMWFTSLLSGDPQLAGLWARHLAGEVQSARHQCEILSCKTVAERLDAFLVLEDHILPPRGRWKDIADRIGVSREALYRELARRR